MSKDKFTEALNAWGQEIGADNLDTDEGKFELAKRIAKHVPKMLGSETGVGEGGRLMSIFKVPVDDPDELADYAGAMTAMLLHMIDVAYAEASNKKSWADGGREARKEALEDGRSERSAGLSAAGVAIEMGLATAKAMGWLTEDDEEDAMFLFSTSSASVDG